MKKVWMIGAVSLLLAGHSYAACKQADAKGTWITYQAAVRAPAPAEPHVGQCQLIVDKAGNITEGGGVGGSFCSFYPLAPFAIPTGGTFKVNKDCSAAIELTLGEFKGTMQLTKNKQMYAGRWVNKENLYGTTTGVKQ